MSTSFPFYGEKLCEAIYSSGKKKGENCTNGGYYKIKNEDKTYKILCGVHSKNKDRIILIKNKVDVNTLTNQMEKINISISKNLKDKLKGNVILYKMQMMKRFYILKGI